MLSVRKRTAEVADQIKTEVHNAGRTVTAIGVIAVLALAVATLALIIGIRK